MTRIDKEVVIHKAYTRTLQCDLQNSGIYLPVFSHFHKIHIGARSVKKRIIDISREDRPAQGKLIDGKL